MTDPINALARPTATTPNTTQTEGSQTLGRDAFMRLLITQLENQDPLDPMDSQQTVTQLSQLTSVEHLMGIEQRMGALEIATASFANTQVASLLGKEVVATGENLRLDQMGVASGAYDLSAPATDVTITIRDAAGNTVRTVELGAQSAGPHDYTWDGLDGAGTRLPPGRYTMSVSAEGAEGEAVAVSNEIRGRVDGVSYESGFPELSVGGAKVLLGDVREVF